MKRVSREFNIRKIKNLKEFVETTGKLGLEFPTSSDVAMLKEPIKLASGKIIPNSIGLPPLEGFDGTIDGNPSDTVFRRYDRYARGGAGLIWYESLAIADDGRCNPLQMIIKNDTLPGIMELLHRTNQAAMEEYGRKPYNVLQLTHSGRRSVDADWVSTPLAVAENPYIDDHNSVDGQKGSITIASDEKIEEIIEGHVEDAMKSLDIIFSMEDFN